MPFSFPFNYVGASRFYLYSFFSFFNFYFLYVSMNAFFSVATVSFVKLEREREYAKKDCKKRYRVDFVVVTAVISFCFFQCSLLLSARSRIRARSVSRSLCPCRRKRTQMQKQKMEIVGGWIVWRNRTPKMSDTHLQCMIYHFNPVHFHPSNMEFINFRCTCIWIFSFRC